MTMTYSTLELKILQVSLGKLLGARVEIFRGWGSPSNNAALGDVTLKFTSLRQRKTAVNKIIRLLSERHLVVLRNCLDFYPSKQETLWVGSIEFDTLLKALKIKV